MRNLPQPSSATELRCGATVPAQPEMDYTLSGFTDPIPLPSKNYTWNRGCYGTGIICVGDHVDTNPSLKQWRGICLGLFNTY
jgi:hypothetical protein